jgi:hypothetical protein
MKTIYLFSGLFASANASISLESQAVEPSYASPQHAKTPSLPLHRRQHTTAVWTSISCENGKDRCTVAGYSTATYSTQKPSSPSTSPRPYWGSDSELPRASNGNVICYMWGRYCPQGTECVIDHSTHSLQISDQERGECRAPKDVCKNELGQKVLCPEAQGFARQESKSKLATFPTIRP